MGPTPQRESIPGPESDRPVSPGAPGAEPFPLESGHRERVDIPWGYARERVVALPIDPSRLYVWWEVTDDAIAAARRRLGPAGKDARLCLRVHDVSGRIFDGTNSHGHFDVAIERNDRQWFVNVGGSGSTRCVEVGLLAGTGRFVHLARSRRVDLPRAEAPHRQAEEWMTVQSGPPRTEAGGGTGGGPLAHSRYEWIGSRLDQVPAGSVAAPVSDTRNRVLARFEGGIHASDPRRHLVTVGPWRVNIRLPGRPLASWTITRTWRATRHLFERPGLMFSAREATVSVAETEEGTPLEVDVEQREPRGGTTTTAPAERAEGVLLGGASELVFPPPGVPGAPERAGPLPVHGERIPGPGASELVQPPGASERMFPGGASEQLQRGGASELGMHVRPEEPRQEDDD